MKHAFLAVALVVASCSSNESSRSTCGPDSIAATALDVKSATEAEAGFSIAAIDPIPATSFGGSPAQSTLGAVAAAGGVAAAVAAAVAQYFSPSSCAVATATANVVTLVLSGCSGPLGLAAVSGTVVVTITIDAQGLHVQLSGSDIVVGVAKYQLQTQTTASLSADLRTRTVQVNTSSNGTGPLGNDVTRMGSYTLSWEGGASGCTTIDGGNFTGVGSRSDTASIAIDGYERCADQCPEAGTVTSTFPGGSLTLAFDGTSAAQCTSTAGAVQTFDLACP